jgi:uncharacterized membrane protein HdeD (DUF308 family)
VDKLFRRTRTTIILSGIAFIVLGVMLFLHPLSAIEAFVSLAGWTLLITGLITTVANLMRPHGSLWADLAIAALEIIPAIFMLSAPGLFLYWLWSLIGLYILLTGINDIFEALALKDLESHHWKARMAMGGLTILMGVIVAMTPLFSMTFGMLICACALILNGVSELVSGIRMKPQDTHTAD